MEKILDRDFLRETLLRRKPNSIEESRKISLFLIFEINFEILFCNPM
jgi:hypothetical protein